MWKIKHIFDGEFGCEERDDAQSEDMVSVTLVDENAMVRYETVPDAWLLQNHLDVGSLWPDYSELCIETADLVLKKARQSDLSDIYENLWRHGESARYMLWEPCESLGEAQARMQRTIRFQKLQKYALFIYERETDRAIGFVGMREISEGVYEDTGLALGPSFVNKGYGTQVLNALTHAARQEGAEKFIASCRAQNIASHRLQMKCGFVFSHYADRVDPRNGEAYQLEFNEKILTKES